MKNDKKAGKGGRTNLQAAVEGLSGMEGSAWWKAQPGKNIIRILPACHTKGPNAGMFYNKKIVHKMVPIEGRNQAVSCVRNYSTTASCPFCDFIQATKESGDSKLEKIGKLIRPQTIFYLNVVDRKSGKISKYGMGKGLMKTLRGYLIDEDYGDVTDPDEGFDIVIEKEGEGLNTRYQLKVKPKASAVGIEGWEEAMFDLFSEGECVDSETTKSAMGKLKTAYGKIVDKLMGRSKDDDDDEDETEDDEDESSVDLDEMDRDELKSFIKTKGLEIKVTKSMTDDDIREAIEEAMKKAPWDSDEEDD